MKILMIGCAFLLFGVCSYADEYCQQPGLSYHPDWAASSTWGSIMADDIPDAYTGTCITDVTFFVREGHPSGAWVNPAGIWIYFYGAECPPAASPASSFYLPWGDLSPGTGLVMISTYESVCIVKAHLPTEVLVGQSMSIGFQVDDSNIYLDRFVTVVGTTFNDIYGSCPAYQRDLSYPTWDPASGPYPADVAFCLNNIDCTVKTEEATWGRVKSLYK